MKILIIEDNELHIAAAQEQLKEHELIICRSYQEAEIALTGCSKSGFSNHWFDSDFLPKFDIVLTDLFIPTCNIGVRTKTIEDAIEKFGAETPYGLVFALVAMRHGIPVAIVSDNNHHAHPINWALDMMYSNSAIDLGGRKIFATTVIFKNPKGEMVKNWEFSFDKLME